MFEEIIQLEKEKIYNQIENNEFLTFAEFVNNPDIPKFITNYFKAFFHEKVNELKLILTETLNLDLTELAYADTFRMLEQQFFENQLIWKYDVQKLLEHSIQLYINFIVRPIQTLTSFLFKDQLFQTKESFKIHLNYFPEDNEFIASIKYWLDEQSDVINLHNFKKEIRQIDNAYTKSKDISELSDWFEDLLTILQDKPFTPQISTYSILSIYANDKKWTGVYQFLNINKNEYAKIPLSIDIINSIYNNYLVTWFKEPELSTITEEFASDESDLDNLDDNLSTESQEEYETQSESDEYEKELIEQSFEGEGETYELLEDFDNNSDNADLSNFEQEPEVESSELEQTEIQELEQEIEIDEQDFNEQVNTQHDLINESQQSEESSEDIDYELLANMIEQGNDIKQTAKETQHISKEHIATIEEQDNEIIDIIENLNNKIMQRIPNPEIIKPIEEFAKIATVPDLNYVDLQSLPVSSTKKLLIELVDSLSKKKN